MRYLCTCMYTHCYTRTNSNVILTAARVFERVCVVEMVSAVSKRVAIIVYTTS